MKSSAVVLFVTLGLDAVSLGRCATEASREQQLGCAERSPTCSAFPQLVANGGAAMMQVAKNAVRPNTAGSIVGEEGRNHAKLSKQAAFWLAQEGDDQTAEFTVPAALAVSKTGDATKDPDGPGAAGAEAVAEVNRVVNGSGNTTAAAALDPIIPMPRVFEACLLNGCLWSFIIFAFLWLVVSAVGHFSTRDAPDGPEADDTDKHVYSFDVVKSSAEKSLSLPNVGADASESSSLVGKSSATSEDVPKVLGRISFPGIPEEVYRTFTARKRCWLFLRHADSGPFALYWGTFINVTIMVSFITMTLASDRDFLKRFHVLMELTEWYLLIVFTTEWVAAMKFCSKLSKQLTKPLTYIDFFAILPSFMQLIFGPRCFWQIATNMDMLILLRLFRLCRILKLVTLILHSKKIELLRRALSEAIPACFICAVVIGTAVFIPAVLMFHVEQGEWSEPDGCFRRVLPDRTLEEGCSPFQNIPASLYWAVTTVTTVGYGDVVPKSRLGKVIACGAMLMGIVSVAIPVGMITSSFNAAMDSMKAEEEAALKEALKTGSPSIAGKTPRSSPLGFHRPPSPGEHTAHAPS